MGDGATRTPPIDGAPAGDSDLGAPDAQTPDAARMEDAPTPPPVPPPSPDATVESGTPPPPPPPPPDAGEPPCDAPCELVSQCGCTAEQRCDLADSAGARACVPDGTVAPGGACGPTAACRRGLCIGVRGDGSGVCHSFCEATVDCRAGARCLPVVVVEGGATRTIPGVRTCSSACALVPSSGCPSSYGCALFIADPDAVFPEYYAECAAAGPGTTGDACSTSTGCSPGFQCLVRQCTRICRVAMGDSDCADDPGTSCRANFEAPYLVDGFEYGFCQ